MRILTRPASSMSIDHTEQIKMVTPPKGCFMNAFECAVCRHLYSAAPLTISKGDGRACQMR